MWQRQVNTQLDSDNRQGKQTVSGTNRKPQTYQRNDVAPTGPVLKAYLRISGVIRSTVLKVMQELQCESMYCTLGKHSLFLLLIDHSIFQPIIFKLSKPLALRWLTLSFYSVFLALSLSFIGAFICSCNYAFIQSVTSSSSLACICLSIHIFSNSSKHPLIHTLIQPCPSVRSILPKLTRTSFHFSVVKKCDRNFTKIAYVYINPFRLLLFAEIQLK